MCLRKSSCGCPGDCEPIGCERERQRDLARRIEEELKKIRARAAERDRPSREPGPGKGRGDGGTEAISPRGK
jgi:hypothetical protein